jgi:glucosamine 6-phosphate synthetase-like amidotransferase/phosphosugar isomerase protein
MGGIIGIASRRNALPGVLQGLQQLAQDGHQHCGLVVHGRQGPTPSPPRLHRHRRAQGVDAWLHHMRSPCHEDSTDASSASAQHLNGLEGALALGHIGLADDTGPQALRHAMPQLSHGPHAHLNSPARVAVVVDGPLQAADGLREALRERDYGFKSDCAAELLAHLIDATCQDDPVQALHRSLGLLQGPVALGVLFHDQPGRMFAVQRGARLHAAAGPDQLAWASSTVALPTGLVPLPAWPDGRVLEIVAHTDGVTHCMHG